MGLSHGIQTGANLLLMVIIVMVTCTSLSSSDLTEDRKECQDKLITLTPCLPFVSGDSKAPTPQCCTQLRNGINNTRKCLCILVKDRNEPQLGFKVNATLALTLPPICHAPSNASDCPVLLNLAPNSTEAQVFEEFASNYQANANMILGVPTSSSISIRGRRWVGMHMVKRLSLSLWFLILTLVCM